MSSIGGDINYHKALFPKGFNRTILDDLKQLEEKEVKKQ